MKGKLRDVEEEEVVVVVVVDPYPFSSVCPRSSFVIALFTCDLVALSSVIQAMGVDLKNANVPKA